MAAFKWVLPPGVAKLNWAIPTPPCQFLLFKQTMSAWNRTQLPVNWWLDFETHTQLMLLQVHSKTPILSVTY